MPALKALGDRRGSRRTRSSSRRCSASGFFTSARIAEQVRAGIQSLPRGQRNAGLALGLTQPQVYRYVLLPMAFRIIIPPLTCGVDEPDQELVDRLLHRAGRAVLPHPRDRRVRRSSFFEAFSAATLIYVVIAMTANRVMAVDRAPGRGARLHRQGGEVGAAVQLDFERHPARCPTCGGASATRSQLTPIAVVGGIVLRHAAGDGAAVVVQAAGAGRRGLRQPDALDPAGAGDLLVLSSWCRSRCSGAPGRDGRRRSAPSARRIITFIMFEAAYFCEIMRAGIQSIPRGPGRRRLTRWASPTGRRCARHPAAGVPQHAAGAADADDHPVPGHLARLRRSRRTDFVGAAVKIAQRDCAPGRDVPVRGRRLFRPLLHAVVRRASGCRRRSPSSAERSDTGIPCNDRNQQTSPSGTAVPGAHRLHDQGREGRRGRRLRAVGVGQVDADQVRQRAGAVPEGRRSSSTAFRSRIRRPTCRSCARASAWCSRTSSCSRTCRSRENLTLAQVKVLGARQGRGDRQRGLKLPRPRRPHRAEGQVPRPALRRPAAARRDRPRAVDGPDLHAVRRADLRARSRDDQRGARRHGPAREGRHDDDGASPTRWASRARSRIA